jgi:MFS transporter, DHA1 family, tetracycline resistance protein
MPTAQPRRAALAFILVTMFLDVFGFGLLVPVLPGLVTHFLGGDKSGAAAWFGLISASFAAAQFLAAPVLGRLSDQVGRRPVLLVSLAGYAVSYVMIGLAPTLGWLFAARILSGTLGASFTAAQAYIADVSTPETRSQNFGLAGAMFGLGFIAGPALGGLLGHFGPRVPFFVAAGVVTLNFLYGLLVLPESLALQNRRPFRFGDANPVGSLRLLRRYPAVAGLALAFVFVSLAQRGMENVWVLYTSYRFDWKELDNGLAMSVVGLAGAFVQGFLIRLAIRRLGERRTALFGLSVSTVAFVLYGLAFRGWMMIAVAIVAALGGLAGPAIQGIVAGSVAPSEQGAVQGPMVSLRSLTSIAAPLVSSNLLALFTGGHGPVELPGAPFFAGALFLAVGLCLLLRLFRRNPSLGAVHPATVEIPAVPAA